MIVPFRIELIIAAGLVCIVLLSGCGDGPDTPPAELEDAATSPVDRDRPRDERPAGILPAFVAVAAEGLHFERFDDISTEHRIVEANGGGVALFDYERDGRLDVFFTSGCRLPLEPDDRDSPSALFRNTGVLEFTAVSHNARLLQYGYAHGCATGDYDADGFDDLYVTRFGRNTLWRNNGDGTFSDVTLTTGTAAPAWSSSAAFADLNRDGHLDLYVVNYLDESDESPKLCPNPASPDGFVSCAPAAFDGVDDNLFLSDGAGTFRDATSAAGLSGMRGKGLGVVVSDLDNDGRCEIFVANDGQVNFLLVSASDPHGDARVWEDRALTAGVALNEAGHAQASMGVASGDYDNNGRLDLFLTHFFDDTNTLYANRGGLLFDDATRRSNLGFTSRRTLGWGALFLDVDNDGWLDLFVANGHVDDREWTGLDEPFRMPPHFYRNARDGSFEDVSKWSGEYFTGSWLGRGAAAGDLDRDGDLDLAVSHQLAPSLLLENATPSEYSAITLRLVGSESNRSGICARIEAETSQGLLVRELSGGGSFQSASSLEVHAGIGEDEELNVRILWPSGVVDAWLLRPGEYVVVEGRDLFRLR